MVGNIFTENLSIYFTTDFCLFVCSPLFFFFSFSFCFVWFFCCFLGHHSLDRHEFSFALGSISHIRKLDESQEGRLLIRSQVLESWRNCPVQLMDAWGSSSGACGLLAVWMPLLIQDIVSSCRIHR